jgi:hypothetical protein
MVRVLLSAFLAVFLAANCAQKSSSATAKEIQINDGGIALAGDPVELLGPGPVYQNMSLPQDFSLPLPVLTPGTANTIDLGRCYLDYLPAAVSLDAQTRRFCGLQFSQVQLELRALLLDVVLPDVRAYCHNQLENCNLSGREFTITVSEEVMRRVQQLFEFYQYTGLQNYFQYNGYQLKKGAKIPFKIDEYSETCVDRFDYQAKLRTRVIATSGGMAETRDDAGDVVIYWDKQRQNILMDFRTSVDVFGYQMNIRRTYDFGEKQRGVRYTSSVNYWTSPSQGASDLMLVHGNAVVAEPCSANSNTNPGKCTKVRHIASEFMGSDADKNGLSAAEIFSDVLRFSEGVVDDNGGIFDSFLTIAGTASRERVVFRGINITDYLFQSLGGSPLSLVSGDANAMQQNYYIRTYAADRLRFQMIAQLRRADALPIRALYWLAPASARDATRLGGFAVSGASDNFVLRWGDGDFERGNFAFNGGQSYEDLGNFSLSLHPLF